MENCWKFKTDCLKTREESTEEGMFANGVQLETEMF